MMQLLLCTSGSLQQVRDNVHLECVLLVKEEADKKIRQEQINNIS